MAYIKKLTDKRRNLPWRVQIRRKGHKTFNKHFKTKAEADLFASEQERSIRLAGLPLTIEQLKKHTVSQIVERYLKEITPGKGCRVSETAMLRKFLRHSICSKALAYVTRQDAYGYRDERLKETYKGKRISPSTVRRTMNSVQHVFEVAKEQWGFSNLQNPFRGIPVRGATIRRKRRLQPGELTKLEQACETCRGLNRYYVPLAIHLAVETGMRLQEVFHLAWEDIDLNRRRIEIRRSKTDHANKYPGRTIVLTVGARWYVNRLLYMAEQINTGNYKRGESSVTLLFPMTPQAFKQSWKDVLKRAGIKSLTFHDLRREAGSRFDQAGLTRGEHDLMMGHANRDMASIYIHADLQSIQHKLDRHVLGGLTLEEWSEKYGNEIDKLTGCLPLIFVNAAGETLDHRIAPEEEAA